MSQEPLPLLAYATPSQQPMPTGVRVLAIVGLCFGTVAFTVDAAKTLRVLRRISQAPVGQAFIFYNIHQLVSAVVFNLLALVLLLSCIFCLKRIEPGRVWLVRYSIAYLAFIAVELFVWPVIMLLPGLLRFGAVMEAYTYRSLFYRSERLAMTLMPCSVMSIVILIYMTLAGVRESFARRL